MSSYSKISCRTVALWSYILVFEHDATDPIVQKVAIYGADFLRTLKMYFSIFQLSSIQFLLFPKSRIFLTSLYILSNSIRLYKPVA
jgi:hypothetical protein